MDRLWALAEQDLGALVGRRVRYEGRWYRVRDALPAEGVLLLEAEDGDAVQEDAFGRAHRLLAHTIEVRVRTPEGTPSEAWRRLAFDENAQA